MPVGTCRLVVNALWASGQKKEAEDFLTAYCLIRGMTREQVANTP